MNVDTIKIFNDFQSPKLTDRCFIPVLVWLFWICFQRSSKIAHLLFFMEICLSLPRRCQLNQGWVTFICVSKLGCHWFRWCLVTYSALSHYLNQWWFTGWHWHLNGRNSVNLVIIKLKPKWNVRNNYSYVFTATKIWFQFQFSRSPDIAFGSHIGWFFNWKDKFGYRLISSIANYVKYNYFEMMTTSIMSCCEFWTFSDFCSRHCWRCGWWDPSS